MIAGNGMFRESVRGTSIRPSTCVERDGAVWLVAAMETFGARSPLVDIYYVEPD